VTLLQDNIRQLVTEQKGGLLSFGILAALWSSSSAVVAITAALNQAYDVEEGRPWWKVRGIALLLTMGLSLFLLLAMVLLIFGPQLGRGLASLVGLGSVFEILWNILRWPVSAGLLMVALALVYYFAPDVEQQWKWITPGARIRSLKHFCDAPPEQPTTGRSMVLHGVRWCWAPQGCPVGTGEGWHTALPHTRGERHLRGTHIASETPRHGVGLGKRVCLLASTGWGNRRWDGRKLKMPQDARDHRLLDNNGNDAERTPAAPGTRGHL